MELKEFIKSTISQIGDAIKELNEENSTIIVNPIVRNGDNTVIKNDTFYSQTKISFHLDLGINEGKAKDMKVGVFASLIGAGGKYENQTNMQNSTSIDFELDVLFPQV